MDTWKSRSVDQLMSDIPAWIHFKQATQAGEPVLPQMIKETQGLFVGLL